MPNATLSLLLLLGAVAALQPTPSQAAFTVCRTVNGRSVCSQSGEALSCQTVNGKTQCLSGSGTMRCDTVNGKTTCSSSPESARVPPSALGPLPLPPALPDEDLDGAEGLPALPPGSGEWSGWGGGPVASPVASSVAVERTAHGLRVRTGTLDLQLGSPR
ncbi:hypothetical protein J2847_002268 [Azospirillum agricola]|uniref:hypothetical protein n=1 Tax=Azospirillum agricola TaxID=1720247 RepID=UPI001AE32490|nr:hypothetical protein [Azospirillum agricola]MBP2228976.1 hypothetical protein [Azospirillum agricola]